MKNLIQAGDLSSRIEFFENTPSKNDGGESITTPNSIGKRWAQRVDVTGTEEEDGRVLALAVCKYRLRFDADIVAKASTLFIIDFDGQWEVAGPAAILGGRRRYMELRCRKRGED